MDDRTEKRFLELACRCDTRGIPLFTDFLDLSEQAALQRLTSSLPPVRVRFFGGADGCERRMAGFFPLFDEQETAFPIVCLRVTPIDTRFTAMPAHRDALGALMSLGFERSLLGDITVREKEIWIFCAERIASFICDNLTGIRNATVRCEIAGAIPEGALFATRSQILQVTSERLDAVVAHAMDLSRSDAQALFRAGRVFVNGAECSHPDTTPLPGQIISVRGIGRFRYEGQRSVSRKGKLCVEVAIYV